MATKSTKKTKNQPTNSTKCDEWTDRRIEQALKASGQAVKPAGKSLLAKIIEAMQETEASK